MDNVNIVFQALDYTKKNPAWSNSKIVYLLRNKPSNYDVADILDAISTALDFKTIRISRLNLEEKVSIAVANRHDGGYYEAFKSCR
jgi:hypothetical protein